MLHLRLLSALVLLPIAVTAAYLGSPVFDVMTAVFAVIMAWEWDTICRGHFGSSGVILAIAGVAGTMLVPVHGAFAVAAVVLGGFSASTASVWGSHHERENRGAIIPVWIAAGAFYIILPCAALVWIRAAAGLETLMWLLCVVWATDIGAYACGRSLGGPLLAPRISPKKTWSGAVGGLLAAVVVGLVAAALFDLRAEPLALASMVTSVMSQLGDLLESRIKRRFGVKDSGRIIPGHGGVLDRVDGLLAAVPLVAVLVVIQGGGIMAWR